MLESYYLSSDEGLSRFMLDSGLALDEVESLIGRFKPHSHRAGHMRGEAVVDHVKETIKLRHHFTKKNVWKGDLI